MGKGKPPRRPRDYFYGEVLRLPPGTKRPDHYSLLGLAFFEKDHDTILRAALERVRVLDACDADPRPAYRQALAQLKVEVREAQMTLLDPARRDAYDRSLTGGSSGADAPKEEEDKEHEIPVGTMFAGRYRIMGEARRGALGVVYDALDSNLRTKVQLSVLRPSLSQRKPRRRRVEQASRQAALLVHPNIVHVDEVGVEDGLVYLRMRAAEGENVLELVESAPHMRLEPEQARHILAEVAAALKYAHAQGAVHGDLRPHNVFVDGEDRVRVADFCTARAVADELDAAPSRYREPEDDPTPKGDLFALGCLGYQMLTGMPPAGGGKVPPKQLPEDVPSDLAAPVMDMLATDPEQRPEGAGAVLDRLTAVRAPRRVPILVGAAAVFVIAVVAALMGMGSEPEPEPRTSVQALAWRLISEGKAVEAIERLRKARAAAPDDAGLVPPLAEALTRAASDATDREDFWTAQEMLAEAQELEPKREREEEFARIKELALGRLAAIPITAPEVTASPVVHIRPGDAPVTSAQMEGAKSVGHEDGYVFSFELEDGRHELPYVLTDRVGNQRRGTVVLVVDTKAPVLEIVEPEKGTPLRNGAVRVTVRIDDPNPPATIRIRGRAVPVRDGEASDVFQLGDGDHTVAVAAADLAGHAAEATRRVVVDSKAPGLQLARERIVTRGSSITIAGRVEGLVERILVDGREVGFDKDGGFTTRLGVTGDRRVPVIAVSATGLRKKASIAIVVDREAPAVEILWPRRDKTGTVLYGSREMDARVVGIKLRVKDKTGVTFRPSEGRVRGQTWELAPQQGARTVRLQAIDEAGNETALDVKVDGHRATPHLVVKCPTKPVTTDKEAVLEVEADGDVFVQGRPAKTGRTRITLPEGKLELAVKAVDHYGNEAHWRRAVVVDRTPPELQLVGSPERGIGRQELVIRSNESLTTVTCVGRTFKVNGKTARIVADLQTGRKRLHVVARDLAGNIAKVNFPLSVRNRVLVLDGNDAVRVDLPDILDAFTVEAWVRGITPGGRSAVLSKGSLADFAIVWGGSDKGLPFAQIVGATSGVLQLFARKAWKWNEWTHVALAFDGRRARFYVDGSLQASVEMKEKRRRGKNALYIGAEPGRAGVYGYFVGAIDEVRVSSNARYTRAFSPQKHFREDDNTVVLLRFDTLDDKRFPDSSGNGRHGVAKGRPRLVEEAR